MSRLIFALTALAVVLPGLSVTAAPTHARSRYHAPPQAAAQDRYCLQGRRWGYPGNCQFATYSQCMATASGTIDACGLNPTYAFQEWKGPRWQ